MEYDEIFIIVQKALQGKYGEWFQVDYKRLREYLTETLHQNLNNISLNENALKQIIINPISLKEYSVEVGKSYSSIFQNKTAYATLEEKKINKKNSYTIGEFELPHFMRYDTLNMVRTLLSNNEEFKFYTNKSPSLRSDAYNIEKLIMNYFKERY